MSEIDGQLAFEFPEDDDDGQLEFAYGDEPETGPNGHVYGSDTNPGGTASNLTLVPTSTTDPRRPRTLAAGWRKDTKTLTVVFRDGTSWNYYDIDGTLWRNFAGAISKGAFIYTYLDPRGASSMGPATGEEATVASIYGYAQSTQRRNAGVQDGQGAGYYGQSAASRRRKEAIKHLGAKSAGVPSKWKNVADALGYKPGNLGGTGRTRNQKADLNDAVNDYYRKVGRPRPGA